MPTIHRHPLPILTALLLALALPLLTPSCKNASTTGKDGASEDQKKTGGLPPGDRMPRFPGCENIPELRDEESKFRCSMEELMTYLGKELKYPEEAKAKGTSGRAVVQFIVQADGYTRFVEILEDPGDGMGEEAARMVRQMQADSIRWVPGTRAGKPIDLPFNLPVQFDPPRDPDTGKIPGGR